MNSMQKLPLSDVTTILMGQSPPGSTYNEVGEGLPFFQGKAEFGELFPTPKKWCSAPQRVAEAGDILISVRAPVGPTNVAAVRCCIGRGLAAIRADGLKLEADYLRFFLRHSEPRLVSMGQGSTFTAIGRAEITSLRIPLPPLNEQRSIVDLLSRAEGIVRLRREAQKKAAEIIPALFLDMFGDPVMNPKGWPVVSLREVAEVISGVAKGRKLSAKEVVELPYMRVANVKDGHLDLSEIKLILIKRTEIVKLRIEPGDLLMTEGGDPDKLGRAALWQGEIDLCVHQNHVFKVRSDRSRLSPGYLRSLAGSFYGKAYFLSVAKKTTGIASINKTQLSAFPVVLPPIREQLAFEKYVAAIESIEKQQTDALQKTEATFNALLARSFAHAGNIALSKQIT